MQDEKTLSKRSYVGYTFVDIGNSLAFSVISSYLARFHTNILRIGKWSSVILIIARIWDGINDPIMGFLAQAGKPSVHGKYRPYLIKGGIPLALSAFLVFCRIPGMSLTGNVIWAFATYIIYGMLYTVVLVPYGSLASVMTYNEGERNLLSVCRSLGGGIGNVPGGIIFPAFVFVANELNPERLMIVMGVFALFMILSYSVGYSNVRENAVIPNERQKVNVRATLTNLIKSRVFIIMSLIGCFLIASNMYSGTVTTYLFPDYFGKSGMMIVYYICSYSPMLLIMPFVNRITEKFGKKEFITYGLIVSAAASLILLVCRTHSIFVFIVLNFIINLGVGFLTLEIWALAVDIIDYQEYSTGVREEATIYSSFTFMRKIGQAIAGLAPSLLLKIGYDTSFAGNGITQSAETLSKMYTVSTAVPFILYCIMLLLIFLYPLSKQKMAEMHKQLSLSRNLSEES